jgi:hypothetical protein
MTRGRNWFSRPLNWLGPLIFAPGIAVVLAALLHATSNRLLFEDGLLSVLLTVDRVLPIVGLGLALAVAGAWEGVLGALLFVLSILLSFAGRDWLSTVLAGPGTLYCFRLIEPIACVGIGVALVVPERLRRWLLPPAGVGLGVLLTIAAAINDPGYHDPGFPLGAGVAAIWLASAVGLTGRAIVHPWLRIGARIFGSWLVAIGLLLGAAAMVPRSGTGTTPPRLTPPSSGSTGDVPFPRPPALEQ